MKLFDALFRWKKSSTTLSGSGISVSHSGKKIHKDIGKRSQTVSIDSVSGTSPRFQWTGHNISQFLEKILLRGWNTLTEMTLWRWSLIILILFLSYIVYGIGFVVRTENNVRALFYSSDVDIASPRMWHLLDNLWRDYQVLWVVAENPIFPLEPLASYGKILRWLRDVADSTDGILALQPQVLLWTKQREEVSIFPILESIFEGLGDIQGVFQWLSPALQRLWALSPDLMTRWENSLTSFAALIQNRDIWFKVLGAQGPMRILFLNQNSDELRAGGGFPGTAFVMEWDEGRMVHLSFHDIYALDYKLTGYRPSPPGIDRFKSIDYPGKPVEFEMRDANYYPLFAESARKIDELAQIAGIGKVDVVVGINQKLLEDIIKLVEPIHISWVPIALDHTNVNAILSILVEAKKTITDTPKWTVKELAATIVQSLHQSQKEKQALTIFVSHLLSGEIAIGSKHPDIQAAIDDLGIFDQWKGQTRDWVYPIFTSISKNKSDRFMERTFDIEHTNRCDRTLRLTQKHWFDIIEEARVKKYAAELWVIENLSTLFFIQGQGDNIQYLRFVLPPGTQFKRSKGWSNFGVADNNALYTTIHWYYTTRPDTTSLFTLEYTLPEKYCTDETYFYKQPGLRNTRVIVRDPSQVIYRHFYP